MTYLVVFVYLLCLSIHYDILGKKGYKRTHYKVAVALLVLVAGLRWRVGSDIVGYATGFNLSHDLFHLERSDFESPMRMPLWVLLNAACKTVWNDFLLVQLTVAALGIGITGYFIKRVCPSLCFYVLLCYFVGTYYFHIHFELLRGSLSISFFLLGILAANDGKPKKVLFYFLLAFLFHVFSAVAVLLFVICYYLLPHRPIFYWICCFATVIITLLSNDSLVNVMGNFLVLFAGSSNDAVRQLELYVESDYFGNTHKSIVHYVWMAIQPIVYFFMYYKIRPIYPRFICLREGLFIACVFLSIECVCSRYMFAEMYRVVDYFYFFTLFLSLVFVKGIIIDRIKQRQRVFTYCVLLMFPLSFGVKAYFLSAKDDLGTNIGSRFFPYSSVFDKTIDSEREMHHQIRGFGYSKYNDYGLVFKKPARRGK